MHPAAEMEDSWLHAPAILDDSERHRYVLRRELVGAPPLGGSLLWIMLNPSTADATNDDPTIRKCRGFAERWGFARFAVGNLFSVRSTNPKGILCAEPNGPEADYHLGKLIAAASMTVVGWGAPFSKRAEQVIAARVERFWKMEPWIPYCLGTTKDGSPRHPLYVGYDQPRVEWKPRSPTGSVTP